MASPLTITPNSASTAASKAPTGPGGDAADGAFDVFAALLGTAGKTVENTVATSSESSMDLSLGNLVNLSFGFGEEGANENEDPEAIAAVVNAVVPFQETIDAIPALTGILDDLANLKSSLDAGEPVDPEALKRIEAALANLGEALGIDLDAMPTQDDLAALVSEILPDDTSFEARLALAMAPVVAALTGQGDDAATAVASQATPELPALIKSIGDKLAALISALNNGDVPADQMAQLELAAEADPALEAALAKLTNPALKIDATPAGVVLATPELELTEPVLTGKASAEAPAPPQTTSEAPDALAPAQPTSSDTDDADSQATQAIVSKPDDRKPDDAKPLDAARAAPTATAVDDQPDATAAAPAVPAARVDAAPAPRVVQAGYQTSQQQLNLPQLAFELVRQIGDGNTRFQIRLDPAELGKIDVRLDIDSSGQVNARLTVEKSETLDLMQRDQRALERALQQAGLDGAKTNLEFSLKQSPFSGGQQGQDGNGRHSMFGDEAAGDAEEAPPPTVNLYRGSLSASGVNIIA